MKLEDLKVENATVMVSNAKDTSREYKISADFRTKEGKITNISNGTVYKADTNTQVANFNLNMEYSNSLSFSYMNEAFSDEALQCTLNRYINEFITISTNKVIAEAAE